MMRNQSTDHYEPASRHIRGGATRRSRLLRVALAGGCASIAFVGVPFLLVVAARQRFGGVHPLAGIRSPREWTWPGIESALMQPLGDAAVADVVIRTGLAIAWLAVIVVAATTAVEVAHLVRHGGLASPRRRGVGWAQPISRVVAGGLVALLPLQASASNWSSHSSMALDEHLPPTAAPTPAPALAFGWSANDDESVGSDARGPGTNVPPSDAATLRHPNDGATRDSDRTAPTEESRRHIVRRGESVWTIAAALGDGSELSTKRIADDILDANLGAEMVDGSTFRSPALILPGWELVVPEQAGERSARERAGGPAPSSEHSRTTSTSVTPDDALAPSGPAGTRIHRVDPGDTLSGIAERTWGDGGAWPRLADANLGRRMTDGRTMTDPDLILPGWTLLLDQADQHLSADGAIGDGPTDGSATDGSSGSDESPDASAPADDLEVEATPPARDWFGTRSSSPETSTPEPPTQPDRASSPPREQTARTPAAPLEPPIPPAPTDAAAHSTDAITPTTSTVAAPDEAPGPSSPLGWEHAGMLAGGVLALAAVRRRRQLRSARPSARLPEPAPQVADVERRLRSVDGAERHARLDVAVRSLATHLVDTPARPLAYTHADDGRLGVWLSEHCEAPPPWIGRDRDWTLPASVPIELLAETARSVGSPSPTLVTIGRFDDSDLGGTGDVLVDLEAIGTVRVVAEPTLADRIVTSIAALLATSVDAETAHLVTVGLEPAALFDHPNGQSASDSEAALRLAAELIGSTTTAQADTYELRARRTGGDEWEPVVVLVGSDDGAGVDETAAPEGGRGLALVAAAAAAAGGEPRGGRLVAAPDGWRLELPGRALDLRPHGLSDDDVEHLGSFVAAADEQLDVEGTTHDGQPRSNTPETDAGARRTGSATTTTSTLGTAQGRDGDDVVDTNTNTNTATDTMKPADAESVHAEPIEPFVEIDHAVVVGTLGGVTVTGADGATRSWQRSKTIELIAWMATHRERSTRSAARTAMWAHDVRDATFSNVVSEARRGLARLAPPPAHHEWIPRTLNDELPLHPLIVTDLDLIDARRRAAQLVSPVTAVEILRPAVQLVRGLPFADTTYLWPDADGLVTNATLLATSACTELGEHALAVGDVDAVFEATTAGLRVLPGHESLIGLRLRAHARRGDLAAVRREWESYERVVHADAWSDGEPAPELVQLRHELLTR